MYSYYSRANSVFVTAVTTLGIVTAICAISVLYFREYKWNATPTFNAKVSVSRLRKIPTVGADAAIVFFDLDADFSSIWNWNTKQIFVSLSADYSTEKHVSSQVVFWDHRIEQRSDAVLKLRKQVNKYELKDNGHGFRNANLTVTLNWNVMPVAGLLFFQPRCCDVLSNAEGVHGISSTYMV
eukprot:gnl/Spiro4/7940_TR4187_c0_g1_i1.p1 gnl/Spiro4/7940_TR4187_c0_g1~~gnl/Spiro4/7940_TR4187_c0_g1_i1.p1  ORF type:complete len:182 (-),score=12.78 gnl/Spiro4/7940_TR4187_c0_g1_i1:137-682(-)